MENKTKQEIVQDVEMTRADAQFAVKDAGEVWTGRNAVASTWRSTKGAYLRAQDRVLDSAHATDETIRDHIYSTLGIALGVGLAVGFFLTNKSSKKKRNC